MLPNGAPDWKNAKYAILEISSARSNELITLCDDPNFNNAGRDYIEVGYNYIGADKKTAGQAAKFQGIAQPMSLENTFPAEWNQQGKSFIENLARGEKLDDIATYMRSRNRNLAGGKAPNEITTSFKKWCAENAVIFGSIDFEADNTRYAATSFLESHLLDTVPKIKEKFEAIAEPADNKDEAAEAAVSSMVGAATEPAIANVNDESKALADAVNLVEGAGGTSLKDIAGSGINIAENIDDLGEL